MVDDEIESGRLVPLVGAPMQSGNAYWLITSDTDFQKPEVKLFRDWLLAELGAAKESKAGGKAEIKPDSKAAASRPKRSRA